MSQVLVLIIKSEPGSTEENIKNLKEVFSDPYFETIVISIAQPSILKKTKEMANRDIIMMNQVRKSLNFASEKYNDLPVIAILDTSITNETSQTMAKKIKDISDSDICYLCKWYEDCQSLKPVSDLKGVFYNIKPKDFQAIFFSKKLRDNILYLNDFLTTKPFGTGIENMIKDGKIKSYCFTPNIVDFDISLAKNDEEYYKLNECSMKVQKSPNEGVAYIWFILIVLLVLSVAWAVIKLGPEEAEKPLL